MRKRIIIFSTTITLSILFTISVFSEDPDPVICCAAGTGECCDGVQSCSKDYHERLLNLNWYCCAQKGLYTANECKEDPPPNQIN